MAVTRINNNQISDASAGNAYVGINAAAKLQDYSITSGKISNNLTYGSDLTVAGNLTVQGNTTTIDTVNVVVEDPLLLLAAAQTGSPTLDIGFIGKRGTSDNVAFVWDENVGKFVTAFTSSEVTNTTITVTSYASFQTLDADVTGNLAVTGISTLTGNVTLGNLFVDGQKTIDVGNSIISNLQYPVANTDAATKKFVLDEVGQGFYVTDSGNASPQQVKPGEYLTFLGTTNEVDVTVGATDNVTIGLPANVTISNNLTVNNTATINAEIFANGNIQATTANTLSIGNASHRFKDLYLSGNTLYLGNIELSQTTADRNIPVITISGNGQDAVANAESFNASNAVSAGGNVSAANVNASANVVATGNVSGGNVLATAGLFGTTLSVTGNIAGGNVSSAGIITAVGNIAGGNVSSSGAVDATGNVTAGNLITAGLASVTGNVVGGNIITAGMVNATGNVVGGNLITAGNLEANNASIAGSFSANNLSAVNNVTGNVITSNTSLNGQTVVASGNVSAGNVISSGIVSATGNVSGGNVIATGAVITANLTASGTAAVTGNITGGNISTAGIITATGNITGGNLNTAGAVTAATGTFTGDVAVANLTASGTAAVTGNVSAGNLNTAGKVVATGNIEGSHISAVNSITAGGNISGGNILTAGAVAATGNVSGGNINTLGSVNATGNITGDNLIGDALYGVTSDFNIYAPAGNNSIILNATGTGTVDVGNVRITTVAEPINDSDAATKGYVDAVAQGLDIKASVVCASVAALPAYTYNNGTSGVGATITANANGALTLDGISPVAGDRVLIKSETGADAPYNGIYVVTTAGDGSTPFVLTRATDMDNGSPSSEFPGAFTFVEQGTVDADSGWVCTTDAPVTVGTTPITFQQFSGAGSIIAGNGLGKTGSTLFVNVDNDTTAIVADNVVVKAGANLVTPNIGNATGTTLTLTGNVLAGNLNSNSAITAGTSITATGNVSGANLLTSGYVSATGNVIGANLIASANIAASGNISGNNISATNQLSGAFLTITGNIAAGNVNTTGKVVAVGNVDAGNVNVVANVYSGNATVVGNVDAGNLLTAGIVSATGNITGGNVLTAGIVSATGNVSGGNLTTAGRVDATGNITGGNVLTAGVVTATGNVSGGNLTTAGAVDATGNVTAGNLITAGLASVTGNITGGNVLTAGTVAATGNVSGGNIVTIGGVTATGNISGFDITASNALIGNSLIISGNINGGNLNAVNAVTAGTTVTAAGNVTAGNLITSGIASVTGNLTAGNLITSGNVDATGNVSGDYFLGNIRYATGLQAAGSNTEVQFNNNGVFGADSKFTFDSAGNGTMTVNYAGGGEIRTDFITACVNVTVYGAIESSGNIVSLLGDISAVSGNVIGANLVTAGQVLATGNVNGGNLVTSNGVFAGSADITGNAAAGNLTVSGTSALGNIVISGDNVTGNGRVTFNAAGDDVDFVFSGNNAANLLVVDSGADTVLINTGTPVTDSLLTVSGSSSMVIPVGNTSQRPISPVSGMIRFNSQLDQFEFYDNNSWTTAGVEFTVIASETFNGDGSTTVFTLSSNQTTASCIVSINGVVQLPVTAYAVTGGTTLTFTEAPAVGDVIEVREITTTTTIMGISNGDASAQIEASANSADIDVTGNLLPTANVTYNLGSPNSAWNDLYLAGNTIHLGPLRLEASDSNTFVVLNSSGQQANIDVGAVDVSAISSGTTAIGIAAPNGNAYVTVGGQANRLVVTTTGANVAGTLDVTGNVTAGNLISGNVTTTNIAGTITTAAQTNITSVGTLGSLAVSGNITGGNLDIATAIETTSISGTTATFTNGVFTNVSGNGAALTALNASNVTTGTIDTARVSGSYTGITGTGALNAGSITSGFGSIDIGTDTVTCGGLINANANGVGNIGSSTTYFNTVFAKATSAQYADLAEMYEADAAIEPGTVVCFGGDKEVQVCLHDEDTAVAGVISTNPSYIMNSAQEGEHVVAVAFTGRVPCKVVGPVKKGDLMVSAGNGAAKAKKDPKVGTVIGKALADFDGAEGVIEVVVGRF